MFLCGRKKGFDFAQPEKLCVTLTEVEGFFITILQALLFLLQFVFQKEKRNPNGNL